MSLTSKLRSIEYDKNRNHVFGIKSAILWGHHKEGGTSPLIYISKPKHVSQEDFEEVLDKLDISLRY